jgi:acyl carrier protein
MTQDQILVRLQSLFDDLFMEPVVVAPELTADDVEEWTSITQISILMATEKAFGIRFRVGEVEATRNVGEFASLIARRMESR